MNCSCNHRRPPPKPEALAVSEAEAARLLGVSPRTLWQLRHDGRGPRRAMIGNSVRYSFEEIQRWLAEQTAASATADDGGAA